MTVDMDFAKQIASGLNEHLADVVATEPRYVKLGYGSGQGRIVKDASKREVYYFEGDLGDLQRGQGSAYLPPGKGIELMDSKAQEGLEIEIRKSSGNTDRWEVYEVKAGSFSGTNGRLPSDQKTDLAALPTLSRLNTLRPRATVPASLSFTAPGTYYYVKPSTGERQVVHDVSGSVATAVTALTSGQHQAAMLYLDTETGLSAVATATAVTAAGALPSRNEFYDFTFASITIPSYGIPLANVYLYYGQTALTEADFYRSYDPRPLFERGGGTGTGDLLADGTVPMTGDLDLDGNSLINTNAIDLIEGTAPSTPASGHGSLYVKTDSKIYFKSDGGTEYDLTAGVGGSGNATYTDEYASRPAPGVDGDLFLPNDGYSIQRDDSASWFPWGPVFPLTEPPTTSWSWANQGSATISVDRGGLTMHELNAHGSGFNNRLYLRTAPSTPYTVTIGFIPTFAVAGNGGECGLVCRESGSGKLHMFAFAQTNLSLRWLSRKWTNETTHSGSDYATSDRLTQVGTLVWMRIADDGTNRICSYSNDGRNFVPFHSVSRTDFLTANQIGLYSIAYNSGAEVYMNVLSYLEA